ncbi:hypothetical protein C8R43DRAFT_1241131, partial [Mycena crocata]
LVPPSGVKIPGEFPFSFHVGSILAVSLLATFSKIRYSAVPRGRLPNHSFTAFPSLSRSRSKPNPRLLFIFKRHDVVSTAPRVHFYLDQRKILTLPASIPGHSTLTPKATPQQFWS